MADNSIEKELSNLETQFWRAIKAKDFEAALGLADDPCLVVGPQGVETSARKSFAA